MIVRLDGDDALLKWQSWLSPLMPPSLPVCCTQQGRSVLGASVQWAVVPPYNKSDGPIGLAHTPFIPGSATSPPSKLSSSSLKNITLQFSSDFLSEPKCTAFVESFEITCSYFSNVRYRASNYQYLSDIF